jgi:hypothetical protein
MSASVSRNIDHQIDVSLFFLFVRVFLLEVPIKPSSEQASQVWARLPKKSLANLDFIVQNEPAQLWEIRSGFTQNRAEIGRLSPVRVNYVLADAIQLTEVRCFVRTPFRDRLHDF